MRGAFVVDGIGVWEASCIFGKDDWFQVRKVTYYDDGCMSVGSSKVPKNAEYGSHPVRHRLKWFPTIRLDKAVPEFKS